MNSGRSDLKLGCEKTLRETGLENSGVFFIVFFYAELTNGSQKHMLSFFYSLKK